MQIIHGFMEKGLIDRLKEGDQVAYELLFHFYYRGLVMYSTQFTMDKMEAEEIVQEIFVRLWNKHRQLFPSDSLKSYLFTSARNASLNFLKHKKVEEKYIRQMIELAGSHLVYDPDLYIVSELQDRIKHATELLPGKCREIFHKSRILGMKNEEIAAELNISRRTVETQISKALKILRIELKDYAGILIFLGIC